MMNIIVTGGSNGIGEAVVRSMSSRGHRVLFTYRSDKEKAEEMCRAFSNLTCCYLDQGDFRNVQAFKAIVKDWCGKDGVDVLINNAALGSATVKIYCDEKDAADPACDPIDADYKKAMHDIALMQVNALGPLWVTEAVMPFMVVEKSLIEAEDLDDDLLPRKVVIFVGSVGGGSEAIFPEYSPADLMSKAAVSYLSKHLAAGHVHDCVDILCINPGATGTDMFKRSTLDKLKDPKKFISSFPKRRLLDPADIAESIAFLALNPAARIFHGGNLDASMGLAVRPGLQTESLREPVVLPAEPF